MNKRHHTIECLYYTATQSRFIVNKSTLFHPYMRGDGTIFLFVWIAMNCKCQRFETNKNYYKAFQMYKLNIKLSHKFFYGHRTSSHRNSVRFVVEPFQNSHSVACSLFVLPSHSLSLTQLTVCFRHRFINPYTIVAHLNISHWNLRHKA